MTKSTALTAPEDGPDGPLRRLLEALERFLSEIPETTEGESATPEDRAREIARNAAIKAALFAGGLALWSCPGLVDGALLSGLHALHWTATEGDTKIVPPGAIVDPDAPGRSSDRCRLSNTMGDK